VAQPAAAAASVATAAAAALCSLGLLAAAPAAAAGPAAAGAVAAVHSSSHNDGSRLDVAAFDSFLQLGQVFIHSSSSIAAGIYVPSALEALHLPLDKPQQQEHSSGSSAGGEFRAFVLPRADAGAAGTAVSDYQLWDGAGQAVCVIKGMQARSIAAGGGSAAQAAEQRPLLQPWELLYEVAWLAEQPAAAAADGAAAAGTDAAAVQLQLASAPELDSTVAAISVLQQLGKAAPAGALLAAGPAAAPGAPAGTHASAAATAAVLGMLRTAAQETPEMQLSTATASTARSAGLSLHAGPAPPAEPPAADIFGASHQAAVSYSPRLLLSGAARAARQYQLLPRPYGAVDSLVPVASELLGRPVPPGQVLVAVKAVGINFRDVLNVLGGWRARCCICRAVLRA
jgi:hypothetical protein